MQHEQVLNLKNETNKQLEFDNLSQHPQSHINGFTQLAEASPIPHRHRIPTQIHISGPNNKIDEEKLTDSVVKSVLPIKPGIELKKRKVLLITALLVLNVGFFFLATGADITLGIIFTCMLIASILLGIYLLAIQRQKDSNDLAALRYASKMFSVLGTSLFIGGLLFLAAAILFPEISFYVFTGPAGLGLLLYILGSLFNPEKYQYKFDNTPLSESDRLVIRRKNGAKAIIIGLLAILFSVLFLIAVLLLNIEVGVFPFSLLIICFFLGLVFFIMGIMLILVPNRDTVNQKARLKLIKILLWIGIISAAIFTVFVIGLTLCYVYYAAFTDALAMAMVSIIGLTLFISTVTLITTFILWLIYKSKPWF